MFQVLRMRVVVLPSNFPPANNFPSTSNFPNSGYLDGFSNGKRICHFCGSEFHLLSNCEEVVKAMKEGKFIRNSKGRLVLPGGGYILRNISGESMLDRFDEWH